jgi:hypothetical protein
MLNSSSVDKVDSGNNTIFVEIRGSKNKNKYVPMEIDSGNLAESAARDEVKEKPGENHYCTEECLSGIEGLNEIPDDARSEESMDLLCESDDDCQLLLSDVKGKGRKKQLADIVDGAELLDLGKSLDDAVIEPQRPRGQDAAAKKQIPEECDKLEEALSWKTGGILKGGERKEGNNLRYLKRD